MSRGTAAAGWVLLAVIVVLVPANWSRENVLIAAIGLGGCLVSALASHDLARRAGTSTAGAAAIGFLFGWIGLLVVWLTTRRARRAAKALSSSAVS